MFAKTLAELRKVHSITEKHHFWLSEIVNCCTDHCGMLSLMSCRWKSTSTNSCQYRADHQSHQNWCSYYGEGKTFSKENICVPIFLSSRQTNIFVSSNTKGNRIIFMQLRWKCFAKSTAFLGRLQVDSMHSAALERRFSLLKKAPFLALWKFSCV